MGDPAGIGGEIILKSLPYICRNSIPVIVGDAGVLVELLQTQVVKDQSFSFKAYKAGRLGEVELVDLGLVSKIDPGIMKAEYGEASYQYIIRGLQLVFLGEVSALVTCPINKASLRLAEIGFTGHTELLAHFSGVEDYVMMMANRYLRVSLVTIHIPLKDVPKSISADAVLRCIGITARSLRRLFGIEEPFIKVCGLNPHAGEKGMMGDEELVIEEAINSARSLRIHVDGPFPADTLFHNPDCDAYIAMYHDQGLIPVKTIDFRRTVNITLGLPFVRVSPGHGTGHNIAGKGIADPTGFLEAYRTAEKLAGI